MQLATEAQTKHGGSRNARIGSTKVKSSEFDGSSPWTTFYCKINAVADPTGSAAHKGAILEGRCRQRRQQITDPSSRQRERYKITNRNCLKENLKEKEKLVAGPKWVPDTKTDWPTDCRS
jgi:hypothetical protein